MAAPAMIHELVDRFSLHSDAYHNGHYNETQLRREFLDPFFEELGWDVFNKNGYAEAYKDVIHEDAIKVGGATKAPDYAFHIGGTRKFFVEAKKPSVNLKDDISPAYQLRRYAWSAKLPLSILTDFEELAIYDCRSRPDKSDKASTGRVKYFTFKDYSERWDEIAGVFARDAILKGSFDKFAETNKGKRGTAEVDHAFLAEIEHWRDLLAHNIALRNPLLSQRELNYSVQLTIDRIIFLRICEDRGIEFYGQLRALLEGREAYTRLGQIFRKADDRYNSGLFHFNSEKDQAESPDLFTLGLKIDDKAIKDIISNLYYPDSPYEFSVLPADILGQVYEQFLGKVIRLTSNHRAVIEDKPEVKKAGGVFYTPTYIVEYIVKNTVGKQLEGKKPGAAGTALRILDPACGSGSFLLGAFQYLLDWYRDGYFKSGPEKHARGRNPVLYQAAGDEWKLTTSERKRILLDHIFGADIDPQAVEVTKLSLLLKVLEGENESSPQMALWQERVLPDLSKNIQCGNSLIGPDFYDGMQLSLIQEEEQYRINAFDWQRAFPEVFSKASGFDVVIGNPPYIRIQALKEWAPLEVEFYKKRYISASKGNYDIYVVFVEKGLSLLRQSGRLGFILPHKFFNAQYGQPLRELIAKGKHLAAVVHFGDQQVFDNATTYTCLMFLENSGIDSVGIKKIEDLEAWRLEDQCVKGSITATNVTKDVWNFSIGESANLFDKLRSMPVKIGHITDRMAQGIRTSANEIYVLDSIGEDENSIKAYSKHMDREINLEKGLVSLFLQG